MPFVQQEVREICDNPTDEEVELLVGTAEHAQEDVERSVYELSGDVQERLPFDSLLVTLPEKHVQALCETTGVESVELDSGMEVLEGN